MLNNASNKLLAGACCQISKGIVCDHELKLPEKRNHYYLLCRPGITGFVAVIRFCKTFERKEAN